VETRIYVDGTVTPPDEAVVPVLDRGFLYGDSVYEVLWWHRGILIQQADHLERLRASGKHLYMDLGLGDEDLLRAVEETCAAAGVRASEDAYVRLMVTRGSGPLGLDPTTHVGHRLVVIVAPANRPTAEAWEHGLHLKVVGRRRNPRGALDPRAKTGNYLNNVLALHEAHLEGADDGVMLNDRGEVTEATTANVYLVKEGVLLTPPLDAGILEGTTRKRILALCREHGIPAREEVLTTDDLHAAHEAFVSSSVRGILPVRAFDENAVGDGRPGPITRRLRDLFEQAADEEASEGEAAEGESAASVRDVREDRGTTP